MDIKDMDVFIKRITASERLGLDLEGKKPDLYIGSRFIPGAKADNMPPLRKIILSISRIVTKLFYGTNVSDPHIGYRVISLPALRKFTLTADGMHYANEFNEQIRRNRLKFEEVPVHIRYTEYSIHKVHGQKNSNSLKL
jgi:hypothetical protein